MKYCRHDNGGGIGMGKSIAELRAEGFAEGFEKGFAEGRAEERAEVLKNLGISQEEYKKILESKSAQK